MLFYFLCVFFFFHFISIHFISFFFFQAEDGIRDFHVTGVQTCALPIYGFEVLLQRDDGRHHIERLQTRLELIDFELHDGFSSIGLYPTVRDMRRNHLLQVVDVVNEDTVQLVHLRIDIARDGDIDEEHGPVLAAAQELLAVLLAEDGVRRARGTDDNVGVRNRLVELLERNCLAIELFGQRYGALVSPIGNVDLRGSMCNQMARGELAHLPRSDQVNALALQVAEDLFRQIDRDGCDRHRRSRDGRLVAHTFCDSESAGQQRVELRIDRSDGARRGISFLHLPQNLRLTNNHRIETGSNAENVPNRIALAMFVKILAVRLRIEAVEL